MLGACWLASPCVSPATTTVRFDLPVGGQVSKLLQYSPTQRYSAMQALTHPFFDELRNPATALPNGAPSLAHSLTATLLGLASIRVPQQVVSAEAHCQAACPHEVSWKTFNAHDGLQAHAGCRCTCSCRPEADLGRDHEGLGIVSMTQQVDLSTQWHVLGCRQAPTAPAELAPGRAAERAC